MKHATADSPDRIDSLLQEIRRFDVVREKTRGVFYSKSRAFLHFHEHDGTVFADVRLTGPDFDRFRVETAADQRRLLAAIGRKLGAPARTSR